MEADAAPALVAMRRENDELRDELAKTKADKEFVWSLWKKLQVASPDVSQAVSLVVQREREKAEVKDQKVLQILHAKDARLAEMEAQNSRLSSELSGLMKQKADLLDRVERLDAEVVSLHDRNRHLTGQIKSAERGSQSQETVSRDSVARSEAEASRLRAQVGSLQAEAADLRDQLANARLTARAAQDDCRAARAEAAVDKERRAQLEGQAGLLQQVQALQEGTQAMLEAQSDELTGLRAELQRWRGTCAELEAQLVERGRQMRAPGGSGAAGCQDPSAPVTDYPYKVAQLEAKIAGLKARLRRPQATPVPQAMVELQSRLNAVTKRSLALEAEARVTEAELTRLRGDLQAKSARVTSLKAALRLAKEGAEERLHAERVLEDNAKLQNELAVMQVQLADHSAASQQLRRSLDFERRANAELRQAVNSAAAAAAPRAEDVRVLTEELESARRKVLQLRDLIARQSRELEGHALARREAEGKAEAARAELLRKNQVLIEMKRYLRHLGRRVTGLRAGAASAVAAAAASSGTGAGRRSRGRPSSVSPDEELDILDDEGWEDLPDDADDDDALMPESGRSLGRIIAAKAAAASNSPTSPTTAVSSPVRPMFVARLQARAGALQQQLLQCRRTRQTMAAERDAVVEAAERLRAELAQSQARCRRLKEACDRAQRQQASKDPGYHSEGPTADEFPAIGVDTEEDSRRSTGASAAELSDQLARCRQAKGRAERELRVARDAVDELRRRLRAADEAAAADRATAERAKSKTAALKETIRRSQSQLDSSRAAAASAGSERRRFEQLWQEARREADEARQRVRQAAGDADRRRRQAEEASARAQAAAEAGREQLARCQSRLSVAERLVGQLGRLLEAKVDAARMLVGAHCDRLEAAPPPLPPPPRSMPSATSGKDGASSEHLQRARDRAAGILNLSPGELDALLGDADAQGHLPTPPSSQQLRRLGELRAALGSREADKQWANQCLRLAQAALSASSTSEADQLLDKFSEKYDEILNAIRLLAV